MFGVGFYFLSVGEEGFDKVVAEQRSVQGNDAYVDQISLETSYLEERHKLVLSVDYLKGTVYFVHVFLYYFSAKWVLVEYQYIKFSQILIMQESLILINIEHYTFSLHLDYKLSAFSLLALNFDWSSHQINKLFSNV